MTESSATPAELRPLTYVGRMLYSLRNISACFVYDLHPRARCSCILLVQLSKETAPSVSKWKAYMCRDPLVLLTLPYRSVL